MILGLVGFAIVDTHTCVALSYYNLCTLYYDERTTHYELRICP